MNRNLLVFLVIGCFALSVAVTAPIMRSQTETPIAETQISQWPTGNCMMNEDTMGPGMMGDNSEDMRVVHRLFANHDQIRRSVEAIPGGVQTITESDNPEIAALIQQHVMSMHQRLEEGRWFAMMSRTLPIMFQNAGLYQRQSQLTDNGIEVTKTSDDMALAEVLREHAQEVTQFVQDGMPCRGGGMMYR